MAEVLDVFLPTRLALGRQEQYQTTDDLEAVVQNTDLLYIQQESNMWESVWNAQELDGAQESYAVIAATRKEETDRLAKLVRERFRLFMKEHQ